MRLTRDAPVNIAEWFSRPIGPTRFQKTAKREGRRVVVCAGDSITHGVMSANYVKLLTGDLGSSGCDFVNAGISGDLAFNLLCRLDGIIGCQPDVVTILIGTNDAAAHIDEKWRQSYMRQQRLPRSPTLGWYRTTLQEIVLRLQAETSAQVVLLEIPPIGEDLDSIHNRRVEQHNHAIHEVAAASGVPLLELHKRLTALLPAEHRPRPFDGSKRLMGRALASRLLLRRSWNEIAARNELLLLTDQIHLNDLSGRVVADVIEEYLLSTEPLRSQAYPSPKPNE